MNKQERRVFFFLNLAKTIIELKDKGFDFMPYEFYRPPEKQALYYAQGASEVKKGLHQVWQACDLVNIVNGQLNWKDGPAYKALDETAKKYGLNTGRNWKTIKDLTHVESILGWIDLGIIKGE